MDNKECCNEDRRVLLKIVIISFSTSLAADSLVISASEENMGAKDAVAINASRLRGKICDSECDSKDEIN